MDRNEFLNQYWNPYPPMPARFLGAGRIRLIEYSPQQIALDIIKDDKIEKYVLSPAPKFSEFLRRGDIVAIVSDQEILLLAPQLNYLPRVPIAKNQHEKWALFSSHVRNFFKNKGFLELKTPSLVACPGTEPSLDVFSTILKVGSRSKKLYLPTSPEIHLKKSLALGADKIFEIAPCFRNGEITERHQPEFFMLEWYRAYADLNPIKKDLIDLTIYLAEAFDISPPNSVKSYTVSQLFKDYCGFDLRPDTGISELKTLAQKLGVDVHSADTIDDYFFLIFLDKIETQLPQNELVFVQKYPPYQAALARMTDDGWGDRFEAYWKGLELANAFHELNDPRTQRLRSQEDIEKKMGLKKDAIHLDEEFFQCLEAGMPPSGGIALGLERLFMALFDINDISDLKIFPYK